MAFGGFLKQNTAVDVLLGRFVDEDDGKTAETTLTLDVELSKNAQGLTNKNDATTPVHDDNSGSSITGFYNCELDATDTNTVGILTLVAYASGALYCRLDFQVLEESIYNALFGSGASGFDSNGRVDVGEWLGQAVTLSTGNKPDVNVDEISDDATAASDLELLVENAKGTDHKVLISSDAQDLAASLDVNMKRLGGTEQSATDLKDFADAGYDPSTNKVEGVKLVDTTTTNSDMVTEPPTASAIVDEWETQSQADPTGFHVNVKEVNGTTQTALDINDIKAKTDNLPSDPADQSAVESAITTAHSATDGLITGLNDISITEVNTEVDNALSDIGLDHLISAAVTGADITDDSIIAQMVSKAATADWDTFNNQSDALEAIRDNQNWDYAPAIAAAVWNKQRGDHNQDGSFGQTGNRLDDMILDDSGGIKLTALALENAPTAEMSEAELHTGLDNYSNKNNWKADVSALAIEANVETHVTNSLNTYDPPTKTEMDNKIDALNDVTAAEVRTEMETADSKLDEIHQLVEDTSGGLRLTQKALEEAPSGTGGDATAANQNTIITHLTDVKGTGFAKDTHSLTDITEDVTGLNGAVMRGTDGANTTVPDAAGTAASLHTTTDGKIDALNNISSGDVETAAENALNTYDPPTKTEMDNKIDSLNNFDPAVDPVANVTLVDTVTTNTDMRGTDGANTTVPDPAGTAASLHGVTDGKIDEVKLNTDLFDGMIIEDSGGNKFTTIALENTPVGGGGDATEAKQDTIIADIAALNDISADDVHDEVVEGSVTFRQAVRLLLSVMTGKSNGGGTTTLTFRDIGDTKNRLQVTVDANGNRTAVGTRDGT